MAKVLFVPNRISTKPSSEASWHITKASSIPLFNPPLGNQQKSPFECATAHQLLVALPSWIGEGTGEFSALWDDYLSGGPCNHFGFPLLLRKSNNSNLFGQFQSRHIFAAKIPIAIPLQEWA